MSRPLRSMAQGILVLAMAFSMGACSDLGDEVVAQEGAVSFRDDVQPLLNTHCATCHSGSTPSGGLVVASLEDLLAGGDSGPALVAGLADNSLLVQRLEGEAYGVMPPTGALAPGAVATVRQWIDEGAQDN